MNSAIVFIEGLNLEDVSKYFSRDVEDEHHKIWSVLKTGKLLLEKDNTCIEDIIEGLEQCGRVIKEVPELVEDICIGYCVIPVSSNEIRSIESFRNCCGVV